MPSKGGRPDSSQALAMGRPAWLRGASDGNLPSRQEFGCAVTAVEAYRKAQADDPSFEVFVIELGEQINTEFTRRLSLNHDVRPCPDLDTAFDEAFDAIFRLLRAASQGEARKVLRGTRSLKLADLPPVQG